MEVDLNDRINFGKERFRLRNDLIVEQLNDILAVDKEKDISKLLMANEIACYLIDYYPEHIEFFKGVTKENWKMDDLFKYKEIIVVVNCYLPSGRIHFARKSDSIDFIVPCVCGWYKDEPNSHQLR